MNTFQFISLEYPHMPIWRLSADTEPIQHTRISQRINSLCWEVWPVWLKQLMSNFSKQAFLCLIPLHFFIHSLHPCLLSLSLSPQLFYFSICHAATTGWSNGHYVARCELGLSGVEIKPSRQAGSAASQCPLKRPQKREKTKAKAEVPLRLYLLAPPGTQLLACASGCSGSNKAFFMLRA